MTKRTSNIFVTVDTIVFRKEGQETEILLIKRGRDPFQGKWAIPGGFVDLNEDLNTAASRELEEETGLKGIKLQQLHTFGKPGRDPRGHMISVTYWGIAEDNSEVTGADDATEALWFSISELPDLAFDHLQIVEMAIKEL